MVPSIAGLRRMKLTPANNDASVGGSAASTIRFTLIAPFDAPDNSQNTAITA